VDRWNGGGFLLSPTLALTAHHVLADVSRVRVVFDHEVVNARVGRVDRTSDLALLELDEPVAGHVFDLAASSSMTGAQVGVIGFPLDEPKTLTVGTVSGLDREVTTETGSYTQMLQTDTAINPGSSGGPVLDLRGRIVGVAGAVRTDAQGIGFAVPAGAVRRLLGSQAPAERLQSC
jgi:S1-C subfamily serine protease